MEHQKRLNLLSEANNFKFVTRKSDIVNDNSKVNYNAANKITYTKEDLKSSLHDYNDACPSVRCQISEIIEMPLINCKVVF